MSSLVLDQSAIDKLKGVEVGVEVRDQHGNLIGFFHPVVAPTGVDQYECPASDDELLRRKQDGGGRPLADILDDLRNRSRGSRLFGRRTRSANLHASGTARETAGVSPRQPIALIMNSLAIPRQ